MADDRPVIQWDRPKLERLKAVLKSGTDDVFTFDGHQFVRAYAEYLVEYLESELGRRCQ